MRDNDSLVLESLYSGILKEPNADDVDDAIEYAEESYDVSKYGSYNFSYLGKLYASDLKKYADLFSWMENIEDEDEMRDFRGNEWFDMIERYYEEDNIPPIIVVEGDDFVDIGDGRGRVTYANWKNIPLDVWKIKFKSNVIKTK